MRRGAGAVIVDLDRVSMLTTTTQDRVQEKEVFPYKEISALGRHTRAYQDQRLEKEVAVMSLAMLMYHNLIH